MKKNSANVILVGAGLASIVAFFLPFLDLGGIASASGWDILTSDHIEWLTRLAMAALPLGGLALIVAGATSSRQARLVGFGFGATVYGFMGYQILRIFFAATGVGLWITLAAALTAIVAALAAKKS